MFQKCIKPPLPFVMAAILGVLSLASCAVPPNPGTEAVSGQITPENRSEPYQRVTLLVSGYNFPDEESRTIKEALRENLTGDCGLSGEEADRLISAGSFELRLAEIKGGELDTDYQFGFHAFAVFTVWKSGDYFAVSSSENTDFNISPAPGQDVTVEERGNDWSDAEEGYLRPRLKSERITFVIGKTVSIKRGGTTLDPSRLYLRKIPIAYESDPAGAK